MDATSRELFWKTLCSLDGLDKQKDAQSLKQVIQYPKYLYRFRPVTFSSLDCLQSNKLFFSSADHYDDPFDSFLHIDTQQIEQIIETLFKDKASLESVLATFAASFGATDEEIKNALGRLKIDTITNGTIEKFREIQHLVQQEMQSICFSEDVLNEQLWLKYAGNHTGFVLEYDMEDKSAFLCGKQETCKNCLANALYYPVYPVYYATEKYNATDFARNTALIKITENYPVIQKTLLQMLPSVWERERIALIKNKCHEYDEEWRIIYPGPANGRPYICWRPSSVTLGLKTTLSEKNLIITLSKIAGIPIIYKCVVKDDRLHREKIFPIN